MIFQEGVGVGAGHNFFPTKNVVFFFFECMSGLSEQNSEEIYVKGNSDASLFELKL